MFPKYIKKLISPNNVASIQLIKALTWSSNKGLFLSLIIKPIKEKNPIKNQIIKINFIINYL